jgi:uncharacterized protein (TIGR02246 family)
MAATPTIDDLREQWIAAFNAHDLDKHMALYAEDATLIGSTDTLHIGRAAIRSYFKGRGPKVHVKNYPKPTLQQITPDVAITVGHVDFADGEKPMPYRVSWTLMKQQGNWRIVHHHGSPRLGVL